MKNQEQTDNGTRQNIFSSDFKQEVREKPSFDVSLFHTYSIPKVTLIIGSLLLIPLLFVQVRSMPHSWWSATTSGAILQEEINAALSTRGDIRNDLDQTSYAVHTLEEVEYIETSPNLLSLYETKKALPSWKRMLTGLDQVIREVVSANTILKQINIGSILFEKDSGQIVLENVRITRGEIEDNSSDTISIAGKLVDSLEGSPFFKNVEASELSTKQQITGTGTGTLFTPVNVQMSYQFDAEKHPNDTRYDLKEELDSLLQQ